MKEKDINSLEHTKWRCQYHIVFAAKYRRQVSLLLLLFMAFGADAPLRPTQKVVWLIGSRRRQKEGKGCAVLFDFQRTGGGYRESPLTFHAER